MADILIIEDDLTLCTQIARHLETSGHHTLTCDQGRAAIKTLKDSGCDVIVLDIRLPGISGIDVLRQIASFPFHPPVIIMTGHGDKLTAIEAIRFGAFDFLEKPFNPGLLDSAIARALENKHDDIRKFRAMNGVSSASEELTGREREVATLTSSGLTNEQIAGKLMIAPETVKFHLKAIFRKLGVENRVKLAARLKE